MDEFSKSTALEGILTQKLICVQSHSSHHTGEADLGVSSNKQIGPSS